MEPREGGPGSPGRVNKAPERRYLGWTGAEDAQLKRDHEAGMNPREMAESHERSLGAIKSRLLHLGLTKPKRDPDVV